jgi:GTP1/Obg family GTP-binding protein
MNDVERRAIHALHHCASIVFPHPLSDQTRYDECLLRHLFRAGNKTKWPPSELSCP